jgi:nucleotide-binding universal stress UspA family protein
VPPQWHAAPLSHAVVAWNGSAQAARALGYALPVLQHIGKTTVMSVGKDDERPDPAPVVAYLARHGVAASVAGFDVGSGSARSRGRALLNYVGTTKADLLVMGAYGQVGLLRFLGLGGATAKVITGCPVPALLAH